MTLEEEIAWVSADIVFKRKEYGTEAAILGSIS